ncbi:MAG: LytTR family transcriptional regulator DNA-binding domain-containing protein [Candidatus Eremiobacterota bacterium]
MKEETITVEQLKKLVGQEVNRQHRKHRPLTIPGAEEGTYKTLNSDSILYAFFDKEKTTIVTKDGKRHDTTLTITDIANLLKEEPAFKITHKNFIVNMSEISRSHKYGRDHGLSFKEIPDIVPVTDANEKEIAEYLNINDLALLNGYKKLMAILSKNKIRDFDEDITTFDRERLYKEFSKSSGEINLTNLMYNLIYQAFTWIREGKMEPIEGNIRSFWYSHVKVALSTLDMVKEKNYDLMIQCFNKFITEWRITTYKSFGFWDANYYANKIGIKNSHIIFMAEKTGHLFILEKLHREYDITTIALGGQGSSLSIEYFVDAMEEEEIDKKQTFYIFSSVDYDPAGYEIKRSFINSLKYEGIKNIKVFDIVTLDRFTPEEIQGKKYPLFDAGETPTKDWETRVKKWVRITGGIGPKEAPWKDRAYGIESDAMIKKIRDVFLELSKPYIKKEETSTNAIASDKEGNFVKLWNIWRK